MRLKALLTVLILATALAFIHREEKITLSYSQEGALPEGAVSIPSPSPLQPAATVSAEELKNLEEGDVDIPLNIAEITAAKGFVPLRYRLLGWQILGIKIIPLFAALTTMLILSVVLTAVKKALLSEKPLILEEKPKRRGRPPKSGTNNFSLKDENPAPSDGAKKITARKKRGRPPKKRPRGRPRKTETT